MRAALVEELVENNFATTESSVGTTEDDFIAASPPDVRRGYAPPEAIEKTMGLCPWFGLGLGFWAKGHTRGLARCC